MADAPMAAARSGLGLGLILCAVAYAVVLRAFVPYIKVYNKYSLGSIIHRVSGTAALVLPLAVALADCLTGRQVPSLLFVPTVLVISINAISALRLIVTRVPRYDVAASRGFVVSMLSALQYVATSVIFRYGASTWFEPIGKALAALCLYSTLMSFIDLTQHCRHYRPDIRLGKVWSLPYERNSLSEVMFWAFFKTPSEAVMRVSMVPSNAVSLTAAVPIFFFGASSLAIPVRYLAGGAPFMAHLQAVYPAVCHFSEAISIVACLSSCIGSFAGTLVAHRRIGEREASMLNALSIAISLFDMITFAGRYPGAASDLVRATFMPLQ